MSPRDVSLSVFYCILFTAVKSTFVPVRTPFNDLLYFTQPANQSLASTTLTQCAIECLHFAVLKAIDANCRCFNYNATSSNCSLFNYEPSQYVITQTDDTIAYQLASVPLQGLWSTTAEGYCTFPFTDGGQVYSSCKQVVDADNPFACYQSDGKPAFCIPSDAKPTISSLLYPLGINVGDTLVTQTMVSDCNNGVTGDIPGASNFMFFGQARSSLRISINGIITFGYSNHAYTAYSFPSARHGIAVFFSDVYDVCGVWRVTGDIFYRVTSDSSLLLRAVSDVQNHFAITNILANSFNPKWMLVVTWNNVTFYGGTNIKKLNTFQVVMVTDGQVSFVMFNYDVLTWTTGSASSGTDGLGGIPATAGFDAGDGVNYYTLPGAMTEAILNLAQSSNCGLNGRWIFRVDGPRVVVPSSLRSTFSYARGTYQLILAENCSLPFTYNGVWYNKCAYNVDGVTDSVFRFGCPRANRTWALCILPADYVALTAATNLVVGSSTVPAMSVFGWIIIHQKSAASSFNWNLPWSSYKNGFGSMTGDSYWFGLEKMHILTTTGKYRLRIEVVQQSTGLWYSAEYWSCQVGDETTTMYKLNVDGYAGDAGDGFRTTQATSSPQCQVTISVPNGMKFTTLDNDRDLSPSNCAQQNAGGFWYNSCSSVMLTTTKQSWMNLCSVSFSRMMMKPQ